MHLLAQTAVITLAIVNARVWTGDPRRPWADAVAVAGDRIEVVGSSAEIRKRLPPSARVIDAGRAMVVPGFTDSHVHFIDGGFRLASVQLRDARTPAEFVARIQAFAATQPKGTWILGGDWDHENWGGELPTRAWVDSVTPDHPLWVNRLDGHMALANSVALRLAGVTRATAEVEGGTIMRDPSGEPAGVLKDNAMGLVDRVVPDPSPAQMDAALDAAMRHVASMGVTSVHHMGSWADLATFERAKRDRRLITRVYAAVPLSSWERLAVKVRTEGFGDDWLRIGGLKGFVDGSIGSHTALMLDGFTDAPGDRGLRVTSDADLEAWTRGADAAGLQVMVHAIGDRAIREQLDLFERVARANGPRDRRFRIEHAQHPTVQDIARFGTLGVIASMQPYHAIDDGRFVDKVIGPQRVRSTYAFRAMLDARAPLAFGSDWFVAPPDVLAGLYAAVTRRTLDDKHPDGWVPEQKVTLDEALRAYTSGGAYAGFAESSRGTLARGMLADLVMLDRDLSAVPPQRIRDAQVKLTMVGGRVVFERE